MLNNEDFEEDYEELSFEEEAEILGAAYENTYKIVTKKVSLEKVLADSLKTGQFVFLPFDPSNPDTVELIIDDTIAYFEDCEEYEKCAELVAAKIELEDDARSDSIQHS